MIVYDKEQKQIVIPNGLGNVDIYNNGVEAGYNQGYDQGQADMAAKARVIEIIKNGVYQSKYSDPIMPIVTGVYADDTKFYGYAELNGKVFNTKIAGSVDSRLEFWYKGDNAVSEFAGYNIIIGAGDKNRVNCFQIRYYAEGNNTLWVEIDGSDIKVYNWDDTVWHHLIVSRAEGLWIDGEKKGDFSPTTNTINGEFYINGAGYDKFGNRPANGYFGMIKIDDTTIIPTANGFKNVNTDELLQVVKDGSYTFAENLPIYGEGELYKTINVDIDVDSYYNNGYDQGKTDGIREQRLKLESINITENGTYYKEDGYREVVVNVPDLNGDYNEGYEQGKADGVNEQKSKLESISITENGTYDRENGYNHIEVNVPDLNGDYNEGYKQGQADLAANARVLNVTENGVYKSKFSDPIIPDTYTVTGVYADGTNFYSYAELNGKVFNTKIAATIDSRLEFWYKGDNTSTGFGDNVIIGAGNNDDNNYFQVRYYEGFNGWVKISIGNSTIDIDNWNDRFWHHLIISKAEGLWIDGEKKGDFTASNTINGEFFINGIGYDTARNANGTFGMIKIDDVVFIPTANGFQNVNTDELLQVVKDGGYNFTENLPIYAEGELYKTINVNVPDLNGSYDEGYNQGKIDGANEQKSKLEPISITENGTYDREDGYNHIEVNVPDLNGSYDEGYNQGKIDGANEQKSKLETINITENGTYTKENGYGKVVVNVPDLNGSYDEGYNQGKTDGVNEQKSKLESISITENGTYRKEDGYNEIVVDVPGSSGTPKINVKGIGLKFGYSTFTEVPEWADFEGITDMSYMFENCSNLQTIPLIDTSNVTNMSYMFSECSNLQTIPLIDTSKVTDMTNMFRYCSKLQAIPQIDTSKVTRMYYMFSECSNLQTIPLIDTSEATDMSEMFSNCSSLVSLPALNVKSLGMPSYYGFFGYSELPKLTDCGGFLNLKCSLIGDDNLKRLPNLTYESCINILNGLYDFVAAGETPDKNFQGKLKVHQNFLDKVGDEISIATSKGWSITAG